MAVAPFRTGPRGWRAWDAPRGGRAHPWVAVPDADHVRVSILDEGLGVVASVEAVGTTPCSTCRAPHGFGTRQVCALLYRASSWPTIAPPTPPATVAAVLPSPLPNWLPA